MLLQLITIYNLALLSEANPFKNYPFVFLLDIGNEELAKTNSEQIRVSVPGGSVALRYPAIGNGETIAHVRVSGIDFGTDLKANIVDGGPGYKYVVLVFIGNEGVPYDAVVTVETKPGDEELGFSQVKESDDNNSAEESDEIPSERGLANSDLNKASSTYSYIKHNDELNKKDNDYKDDSLENKTNNDNLIDNIIQRSDNDEEARNNLPSDDALPEGVESRKDIHDIYRESPDAENEVNYTEEEDKRQDVNLDNYKIGTENIKERENGEIEKDKDSDDIPDDPLEIDQMFNDEEVHNDMYQKSDRNNNYDADDTNTVDY